MKRLVWFSIFLFITVSCAPSEEEIQQTVQAIIAETETAPTATFTPVLPTNTPTSTPVSPTATQTKWLESSIDPDFPVVGSVEIQGGVGYISAFANETRQVQVEFSAISPFGKVTKMRVSRGWRWYEDLERADWEPFMNSKTYLVNVILNWSGFYIAVQFQDENGHLSPVYHDDIGVEGMFRTPLVDPTDWYPQIQCFSINEVHPSPGEVVTDTPITFSWPNENTLPEGVFYRVFAYGLGDNPTGLLASGQTGETSITLQIPPEYAGEVGWYLLLVDANGTYLNHAQCRSFPAGLVTVDPPVGIRGIRFWYRP